MTLYIQSHYKAVSFGFGGGKLDIEPLNMWDFSISFLFWTFGVRYVSKAERQKLASEIMKMEDEKD